MRLTGFEVGKEVMKYLEEVPSMKISNKSRINDPFGFRITIFFSVGLGLSRTTGAVGPLVEDSALMISPCEGALLLK